MSYTVFEDVQGTRLQRIDTNWDGLIQKLEAPPEYPSKDRCPLLKLAAFGDQRSHKGSLRTNTNMLTITGVEGDYDGGKVSPEEAAAKLQALHLEAIIYTTPSHTAEKPRWRVLAPLSKPYAPSEREGFVELLNGVLEAILNVESFTQNQSYYFGRVSGVEYKFFHTKGYPLDELDLVLSPIGKPQGVPAMPVTEHSPANELGTPESDQELIRKIQTGEDYHHALLVLSARYASRGMAKNAIIEVLQGNMRACQEDTQRWKDRYDDIPRQVEGAVEKYSPDRGWGIRHGRGNIGALTEVGNAERLRAAVGNRAWFVPELKLFLLWDGRWIEDEGSARLTQIAKAIPKKLYQEAQTLLDSDEGGDARKVAEWALKSQTTKMIDSALNLLSREPSLRMSVTAFDANPLLAGLDGGSQVLDLETGQARPATPNDYVTKSLGVSEVGDAAQAVIWRRFLNDVFDNDQELIDWMQRWCGYLLTGKTSEQCFLFLYGTGRNGKSVFIKTLTAILGDYARAISSETLMQSKRDPQAASPDLARLVGARLVTSVETEEGKPLAESLIKQLTGGDKVLARMLHKDPFEFEPAFKIMIAGNHKPVIHGSDMGIWRRIHLVPFTRTFTDGEADSKMEEKLKAELPHIVAWMVEGYEAWREQGLGKPPRRVSEATLEYRDTMDTIGQFISDECELVSGEFVEFEEIFKSYQKWCQDCGLRPPTKQGFGRKMAERPGVTACKRRGVRGYSGIRLINAFQNLEIQELL